MNDGALTEGERQALQRIADQFGVTIDVVGSRGAGNGRNVETDLPFGKGDGTRSDIDVRIDGQVEIDTRGALSDALYNTVPGVYRDYTEERAVMQEATAETEHLSTVGDLNPLRVLEQSGTGPIVLCAVAVWTRRTMIGNLEEKGIWVRSLWGAALKVLPKTAGCRLGWNTVFFAVPDVGVAQVAQRFSELLQIRQDARLMSFCALCEAYGEPQHKLNVLDVLGHEISSQRDFGSSRDYRPDGYRVYHLRDGKPYIIK